MDGSGKTPKKCTEGGKEDLKVCEAASSAQGSGEGGWGCCLKRGGFIPPDYRNELVQLFKLAGPVVRPAARRRPHDHSTQSVVCVQCACMRVSSWLCVFGHCFTELSCP